MNKRLLLAAVLALSAAASFGHGDAKPAGAAGPAREQTAWGIAGDPHAARRTVTITMGDDMRFDPAAITVRQGETVHFRVRNSGKQVHEFVLGTKQELDEHAALMLKFPAMEHDEAHMAHVKPGETGDMVWNFNRAGAFEFACLVPGHAQAGMVGKLTVTAARGKSHE
ncbi:plastocyanin/azurin family copper-binding protein [Caenimonas terrae]|uniref:Plastocyanin/azurin family copper-binding protein n=1 Tax=Caenimonas terrae TaxID=696074 RepID=A0ABW0NJJ9_9BURK